MAESDFTKMGKAKDDISLIENSITNGKLKTILTKADGNTIESDEVDLPAGGGGLTVININTATSSGTLNSDDFAKVQANPQNVVFYSDEDIYQLDSYEESTPYYQYRKIVPNAAKNGFYDNILRIDSDGAWTFTQNTISGGSGGGTQLYRHDIGISTTAANIGSCNIISTRATAYTNLDELILDFGKNAFFGGGGGGDFQDVVTIYKGTRNNISVSTMAVAPHYHLYAVIPTTDDGVTISMVDSANFGTVTPL